MEGGGGDRWREGVGIDGGRGWGQMEGGGGDRPRVVTILQGFSGPLRVIPHSKFPPKCAHAPILVTFL